MQKNTYIDTHFIFSSFVVHGIPYAHTSEKRQMKRCVVFIQWFSGDMADAQAGSGSRESPSNIRPGGELSFSESARSGEGASSIAKDLIDSEGSD